MHKRLVPTPKAKVTIRSDGKLCLKLCCTKKTTEANLMKLRRKVKDNENVSRAQDLGLYIQGQGYNQVMG